MPAQLATERQPLPVPRAWHRGRNALAPRAEPRVPAPAQLYSLTTRTFLLHVPDAEHSSAARCSCCSQCWPCPQVRLAFRLREAF